MINTKIQRLFLLFDIWSCPFLDQMEANPKLFRINPKLQNLLKS